MGFAFPAIDPETTGQVTDLPVPIGRYLDAAYSQGQHDSILGSLTRMSEVHTADIDPTSPILHPDQANERYAIGDLKFDRPIRESVAQILNQRKRDEMDRQFFMSKGSSRARFLPGMAAQMIGGVLNPLDLAVMFVPFVGEERAAIAVAEAGGGALRQALARRLITREAIGENFPRFPGIVEAAINGGLQQTLFEVPNLFASSQDRADYGLEEAVINVTGGALITAGIHGAVTLIKNLSSGTRMEMARKALNDFAGDESIDVGRLAKVDDGHITDKNVGDLVQDLQRKEKLKQQELDLRAKAGETLTEEEVKKRKVPTIADESDITSIDQDIAGLKESLKSDEFPQAPGVLDQLIRRVDEHIKNLESDPIKLMMDPFLIQTLGKPIVRGLLIALREGLQLTKDIEQAIIHAMDWFQRQEDVGFVNPYKISPKLRELVESEIVLKDFTYTVQSELAKPQPFNVTPERFIGPVIMKKIGQLPKPEQIMLRRAGVEEWLKQFDKQQVPIDKLKEFVNASMMEPEIRPMLNVEKISFSEEDLIRKRSLVLQHELETAGFTTKSNQQGGFPDIFYPEDKNKVTLELLLKLQEFRKNVSILDRKLDPGHPNLGEHKPFIHEDELVDQYVSQNVSVPIPFEKMEKPRTIFLAADQDVHVESSHYGNVKFEGKYEGEPIPGTEKWTGETRKYKHKNMLAWAETRLATLLDGRRVIEVFELQSDVRQSFTVTQEHGSKDLSWGSYFINDKGNVEWHYFATEKEAKIHNEKKFAEYQEKVQPLIDHTDEILLKAVVKLAKREGLDGVVISDPRTAMLTQGHLGEVKAMEHEKMYHKFLEENKSLVTPTEEIDGERFSDYSKVNEAYEKLYPNREYEPPTQAPGMIQAYGQKLPSIMQKITGRGPEHVTTGEKHMAYDRSYLTDEGMEAMHDELNFQEFNRMYPGSESPSGNFFSIKDISADRPYEMFTNKMPEPIKPQVEAITTAVECLLRKI